MKASKIARKGNKPEPKNIRLTSTFEKIMEAYAQGKGGKSRIFLDGGTSSSKTYSAMQFIYFLLPNWIQEPILFTVVSESMPHLKSGAIADFLKIMGDELDERRWNRTDMCYTWPNGCKLEFVSGDHPERFSGPRRFGLFLNELYVLSQGVYREADLRTSRFVIADWNPYGEFWFHDELLDENGEIHDDYDPETGEVIKNFYAKGLTYNDAPEVLPNGVRAAIESYKDKDPMYYRVHALGLLGKVQGLVYPKFEQVDRLPKEGKVAYGLDYGFSSDPTALVKCVVSGENLFSHELIYRPGLTNDDIARELTILGIKREPIYADGNEPKSAEELRRLGFNVIEVDKALMKLTFRIQRVNQFYQYWTKDSINAIKEQRNYRYLEDKMHPGRFTDKLTHQFSHAMSAREFCLVSMNTHSDMPIEPIRTLTFNSKQHSENFWDEVLRRKEPDHSIKTLSFRR